MVIDSSVWIEIFLNGPLSQSSQKLMRDQVVRVPTLVLHEVYKKIAQKAGEALALEALGALSPDPRGRHPCR